MQIFLSFFLYFFPDKLLDFCLPFSMDTFMLFCEKQLIQLGSSVSIFIFSFICRRNRRNYYNFVTHERRRYNIEEKAEKVKLFENEKENSKVFSAFFFSEMSEKENSFLSFREKDTKKNHKIFFWFRNCFN